MERISACCNVRQPDAVAEIAKTLARVAVGGIEREQRVERLADGTERHLVDECHVEPRAFEIAADKQRVIAGHAADDADVAGIGPGAAIGAAGDADAEALALRARIGRARSSMAATMSPCTRSASVSASPQVGKAGQASAQRSAGNMSSARRTPCSRRTAVIASRSSGRISLRMMSWLGIRIGSQPKRVTISRNAVRRRAPAPSTMRPLATGMPR